MSIYKGNSLVAGGSQVLPLLTFIWSDCIKNHPSWLRADTFSWQPGLVYIAAYQHLVDDYTNANYIIAGNVTYFRYSTGDGNSFYCWKSASNVNVFTKSETPSIGDDIYVSSVQPAPIIANVASAGIQSETIAGVTITYYQAPDGHKLVLPDQESNVTAIYNATGVAWYYIIDTTNQRFKLPRTKFGFTGIRSGVGAFVEAGLPNITGNIGRVGNTQGHSVPSNTNGAFSTFSSGGGAYGGGGGRGNNEETCVSFNASRSSSIYGNSDTVQPKATEMYLYFYVGNFTQTALENTAGVTTEVLNDKADLDFSNTTMIDYVVEKQEPTSSNNYTWYRKYKSGWVEQGGETPGEAQSTALTINLPVIMANSNYYVGITSTVAGNGFCFRATSRTTIAFVLQPDYFASSANPTGSKVWQVSGMAAN